jgi:hypothetical protein
VDATFWAAVAAIAQAATVLVAGWALIYARGQVREARETRERVARPDVVVYVDHHAVRRYMDLVVKNFGQTTAYNIRLILPPLKHVPFRSQITGEMVTNLPIPKSIAVLAPGQEWRTVWESAVRRGRYKGDKLQTQFVGAVEFDDRVVPTKPGYRNPVSLDIDMFWNTTWIERNETRTVKDALYDIAGTLKSYQDDSSGVWVYPLDGEEERHRRVRESADNEAAFDALLHDIGIAQETKADEDVED